MVRGELCQANLDPISGSEQGGTRPVLIVSRDAPVEDTLMIALDLHDRVTL